MSQRNTIVNETRLARQIVDIPSAIVYFILEQPNLILRRDHACLNSAMDYSCPRYATCKVTGSFEEVYAHIKQAHAGDLEPIRAHAYDQSWESA